MERIAAILTVLGRHLPNNPASEYLAEQEWKALYCFIHRNSVLPERPPPSERRYAGLHSWVGFLVERGMVIRGQSPFGAASNVSKTSPKPISPLILLLVGNVEGLTPLSAAPPE